MSSKVNTWNPLAVTESSSFKCPLLGKKNSALSECVTLWEPETTGWESWPCYAAICHMVRPPTHPSVHRLSFLPFKKQVWTSVVTRNTKGRSYLLEPISDHRMISFSQHPEVGQKERSQARKPPTTLVHEKYLQITGRRGRATGEAAFL